MSNTELQQIDDNGLQKLWNELAVCFEGIKTNMPRTIVIGFFSLSRETERRGLKMDKNIFGDIILVKK